LISEVVLLSICWSLGLIVLIIALFLLGFVPDMICMWIGVYYRIFGIPLQAQVVLCTQYEGDGLAQQFLVKYQAPCNVSAAASQQQLAAPAGGEVVVAPNTDTVEKWIFNPSCVKDIEHPDRARWPRLTPGDTVDVMVLLSGCCSCFRRNNSSSCRMRDTRHASCFQSFALGVSILMVLSVFMVNLWLLTMALLDQKHCGGAQWCCALATKICGVATFMLSVINFRLGCLRRYKQDRTRALANDAEATRRSDIFLEDYDVEQELPPTSTATAVADAAPYSHLGWL
jgi:hypothetical protein